MKKLTITAIIIAMAGIYSCKKKDGSSDDTLVKNNPLNSCLLRTNGHDTLSYDSNNRVVSRTSVEGTSTNIRVLYIYSYGDHTVTIYKNGVLLGAYYFNSSDYTQAYKYVTPSNYNTYYGYDTNGYLTSSISQQDSIYFTIQGSNRISQTRRSQDHFTQNTTYEYYTDKKADAALGDFTQYSMMPYGYLGKNGNNLVKKITSIGYYQSTPTNTTTYVTTYDNYTTNENGYVTSVIYIYTNISNGSGGTPQTLTYTYICK